MHVDSMAECALETFRRLGLPVKARPEDLWLSSAPPQHFNRINKVISEE